MSPAANPTTPSVERWVGYDSNGFVSMPWRLGYVLAPMIEKNATTCVTGYQRSYDAYKRIIALEVVASRGVVRALARALRHGESVSFGQTDQQRTQSVWWGHGGLMIFEKKLPSGPTHALLLHPQAVATDLDPQKPVYAVAREEDPAHAYRILNAALSMPILPAWAPWLLETGERPELVFQLTSENLWGIEISPNMHTWAEIVREGLSKGALRWDS
ncbi:MAG TPA: hypothetical protein VEP50_21095 [bacterium]|nr:hypothetical protein [bacterium]